MPEKLTGRQGIMEYLRNRVGQVIQHTELFEASGRQTEFARRIREIRSELGWKIETSKDALDLGPKEYRLAEAPPESHPVKFQRNVSTKLRAEALARNGFTCQMCGAGPGDLDSFGRKVRLEAGHIVDKDSGGEDILSNLRVTCSECNNGAKNIVPPPPNQIWLLSKIRGANNDDQKAVYEWLRNKFGDN